MLYLKSFCFNPFQENTYVLYEDTGEAFIIDPGNSTASEDATLSGFIGDKKLRPTRLLLTHAHIDHVMGNRFVFDTYNLLPEVHENDLFFIDRMQQTATMYGVKCEPSPVPEKFLKEHDVLQLGHYSFNCIFTPGHSPGSLSFYNQENKLLISGDVLFNGGIGRSDLPMGNHDTLIKSIKEKLFSLPDDVKVYSGHGQPTTIGHEKTTNPFLV
jgi:hydroxyacylglutathione hydrolase